MSTGIATRNLAVLFADVSGSTTLYEKLGDRAALDVVDSVTALLKHAVGAHDGQVVKTTGDGVMAVFADPDAAVGAATEMQSRVSALAPFGGTQVSVRIGFHVGEVLEENGDCFGDAVNVAARMAGVANGGQIITTAWTVSRLSPLLRQSTREVATLPVKGKREEMQVYEVVWQTGDQVTMFASRDTRLAAEAVLSLTVGQQTLVMGSDLPVVQIGRDAGNHIVVSDAMASRLHGRIERRGGKYYYVDVSTNGTYITLGGDSETLLRRDQTMLRGRGTICCGLSASDADASIVRFALDINIKAE
jgi:class 3 adenylate cyclase